MAETLRIGMIGCGEIAYKATGQAVADCSNATIVAAMDTVADIAKSFTEKFGGEATTDAAEVMARDDVDAVLISVPHFLHAPLAIQAAEAGKHVLVEKPIACTTEQAKDMIAACSDAGVLLSVLLPSRYSGSTIRAKELVEAGALGKILALKFHVAANKLDSYWTGGYTQRVRTDWRKSKENSGGGVLIMNLVHDIDAVRYATGLEAIRIYAEYDTFMTDTEVEDFITVSIRYDNGAIGDIMASSCVRGGEGGGTRIYGSEGQMAFGRPLRVFTEADIDGLERGAWTDVDTPRGDGRATLIERFAEAVFAGTAPEVPGEEGRNTLDLIYAAYRSGETHTPVTVPTYG
ncbi:MAG: Gfo/Idh/MocA family oxidoreductase [Candidatus Poribacteria bacterium]